MNYTNRAKRIRNFIALPATTLLLCLAACAPTPSYVDGPPLEERATAFGDLLQQLATMDEAEATSALEDYIMPTPDQAERIATYYAEFTATAEMFTITSQSVKDITVASDGMSAKVTYTMVGESPNGTQIPANQLTQWHKIEGNWYRTTQAPGKSLGR